MRVIYTPDHTLHQPQFFLRSGQATPCPEKPQRGDVLRQAVEAMNLPVSAPQDYGLSAAASVHTPQYMHFLQHIHARWRELPGSSEEVTPNCHPLRRDHNYPDSAVGQAGYHQYDTSCPIGAGTWQAALLGTHCAATAADCVLQGGRHSYALCRPPGHHASADMAGGFCYFNNSAVAAMQLRQQHARVAIIDVDLHHGNGTQNIFYRRADVFTASIHADPRAFYPFFWGHAHEHGADAGDGYNFNVCLAQGSGDEAFLAGLDQLLHRVEVFDPGAVVIALGLDASEHDPFGGLAVTTEGFNRIGQRLAALGTPSVIVQEGGYLCDALGDNLQAVLSAF